MRYSFLAGFFLVFLGPHPRHVELPRLGADLSYSRRPMPQPQQGQIQAVSVPYTVAHANAWSFTRWARPGIEPKTSWFFPLCHNGNSLKVISWSEWTSEKLRNCQFYRFWWNVWFVCENIFFFFFTINFVYSKTAYGPQVSWSRMDSTLGK